MAKTKRGGGRKPPVTKRQLLAAIKGSKGIVVNVAARLDRDWNTAKKYIIEYAPESTDALAREREIITDVAEDRLVKNIYAGEQWAVTFWLRTIGKKRGFSERHEITGVDEQPLKMTVEFV